MNNTLFWTKFVQWQMIGVYAIVEILCSLNFVIQGADPFMSINVFGTWNALKIVVPLAIVFIVSGFVLAWRVSFQLDSENDDDQDLRYPDYHSL